MSQSVSVYINKKGCESYSYMVRYDVVVRPTADFMNEPKEIVSDEARAEYISQRIKEEFYKLLIKK